MKHQWKPLLLVAYVFIFTGAIICMNDVLLPSLKDYFGLTYLQASAVQQSFFLVYLIFPIPIAYYISRFGYRAGLVTALIICSVGALVFLPAYLMSSFVLALLAIFTISIGVTLVNVAANPLAALLGDPEGSHVRVNFVQLFSRIGFAVTPVVATRLIYGESASVQFHLPYLILGAATLLLAVFIFFSSFPTMRPSLLSGFTLSGIIRGSRRYPQLLWGAVAMFFYMGAEACTAGFMISYLREVAGYEPAYSANFLTYYYLTSTVFCIAGIYLLQVVSAGRLVALFGIGMILMYILAVFTTSVYNPWYFIGLGAFISIMFPTIFSLGIEGIGDFTEKGSALINIAVVGGAVFPPVQGWLADQTDIQQSYLIPCICIGVVVFYGIYCDRRKKMFNRARPVLF